MRNFFSLFFSFVTLESREYIFETKLDIKECLKLIESYRKGPFLMVIDEVEFLLKSSMCENNKFRFNIERRWGVRKSPCCFYGCVSSGDKKCAVTGVFRTPAMTVFGVLFVGFFSIRSIGDCIILHDPIFSVLVSEAKFLAFAFVLLGLTGMVLSAAQKSNADYFSKFMKTLFKAELL